MAIVEFSTSADHPVTSSGVNHQLGALTKELSDAGLFELIDMTQVMFSTAYQNFGLRRPDDRDPNRDISAEGLRKIAPDDRGEFGSIAQAL